ncbi:hypothetical protein KRX54_01155 [Actinomycetaceae bacterium TAE3-ERU4]|nr:hypothetical protein [Actinomycetaceae bacterium TAE3-ERU4]
MNIAEALGLIAKQPACVSAQNEATKGFAQLRFARGLRNSWEAARSEANILTALHSSRARGLIVTVPELHRLLADKRDIPETYRYALANWRMQSVISATMPPLNLPKGAKPPPTKKLPFPQLLNQLWLAYEPTLGVNVPFGLSRGEINVAEAILEANVSGWIKAGIIWAELGSSYANVLDNPESQIANPRLVKPAEALGMALARYVLVQSGSERTGVSLLGYAPMLDPQQHKAALESYRSGTLEGVNQWLNWWGNCCQQANLAGERLSQSILAGITWDGTRP